MEIINDILVIKTAYKELRLGQILLIAARKGGWVNDDLFYCPDDVIKQGLQKWLYELSFI